MAVRRIVVHLVILVIGIAVGLCEILVLAHFNLDNSMPVVLTVYLVVLVPTAAVAIYIARRFSRPKSR